MKKWTIDVFARALAEKLCEERGGSADADRQPRKFLVDDLAVQILGHLGSLARMRAISPRHPITRTRSDPSAALVGTHLLTRVDAEIAERYIRGDDQAKADFPAKFAKWQAAGRWTLWQAADILEMETGKRYESLLDQLKEAALNGDLLTYDSGWPQPIEYSDVRPVRQTDESPWFKINSWLVKVKIAARVHSPAEANALVNNANAATRRNTLDSTIDTAIAIAGTRDTNSVWCVLKEMAISGESPFTGLVQDESLIFQTKSKNKLRSIGEKALGQRLTRRANRDTPKKAESKAMSKATTKNPQRKKRTVKKDR